MSPDSYRDTFKAVYFERHNETKGEHSTIIPQLTTIIFKRSSNGYCPNHDKSTTSSSILVSNFLRPHSTYHLSKSRLPIHFLYRSFLTNHHTEDVSHPKTLSHVKKLLVGCATQFQTSKTFYWPQCLWPRAGSRQCDLHFPLCQR